MNLVNRPSRADARRNYDALIAAAGELFAERGPDAPLDVIARRAGVGNATLYRHFPTRRDLLVAVSADDVERLCALAERLDAGRDGLVAWLEAYVEHVGNRRGLASALAGDAALVSAARAAVTAASSRLLAAAQEAGEVRADVEMVDLLTLVNAAASAGDRAGRLLTILLEGI